MNSVYFVAATQPTQFAAMSRIHSRGWRSTYPGYVPADYLRDVVTEEHWIDLFRIDYETGRCHGLMLFRDDTPVACCNYGPARPGHSPVSGVPPTSPVLQDHRWGEVLSFYTDPAETGKGYGSLLMKEALRRLKAERFTHCCVYVLQENQGARRFYARHGFSWDGTHLDILFPHDAVCVDLRYTKVLE